MKNNWKARIGTILLAASLVFSAVPVFAAGSAGSGGQISVTLTDVTASDTSTLSGEAKVKVSVQGAEGSVSIAQTALKLQGDLKYKSVKYLKGADNPDSGDTQVTNVSGDKITTGIISSKTGLSFGAEEDLFVLTFSGEPGAEMTISLTDLENTYFTIDGKDYYPKSGASLKLNASTKENKGKTATVKLTMDKVTSFSGKVKSGIVIKITSEKTANYSVETVLDNAITSKGGHRDGQSSIPKFTIENTVLADDTYTVEVSGIGYLTYKKTGVTFDKALEITNADFVPGDVNGDGKVDAADKALVQEYVKNGETNEAADFNRDGRVDSADMAVLSGISEGGNGGESGGSAGGGGAGGGAAGGGGSAGGAGGGGGADAAAADSTEVTAPEAVAGEIAEAPVESFTDLGSHAWAKDAIYSLKTKGIINGTSETKFSPASNIKRGDFILILTKMLGIEDSFSGNFADVSESSYYYKAIGSARAAGIAQGSGESFRPENSITREDLITLAYRAFLAKGLIAQSDDVSALENFADKTSVSSYAQTAMASMVKAGIIQGAGGNVNPKGNATRAEVAVMCARLLELTEK